MYFFLKTVPYVGIIIDVLISWLFSHKYICKQIFFDFFSSFVLISYFSFCFVSSDFTLPTFSLVLLWPICVFLSWKFLSWILASRVMVRTRPHRDMQWTIGKHFNISVLSRHYHFDFGTYIYNYQFWISKYRETFSRYQKQLFALSVKVPSSQGYG